MVYTRRKIISTLEMLVDSGSEKVQAHTFQKRPNTCTVVRFFSHTGMGFSKVCYPDVWDGSTGKDIATRKALQDLGNNLWDSNIRFDSLEYALRKFDEQEGE